jgi:chromosome segregation ATPase
MELNNRITALTNDMNAVKAAEARAVEQEKLLGEYKTKMTDDLAKMKFELTELTAYNQTLAGRVGEVRAELVQLFHSNKALSAELAALNAKMTDQIERRTQSAANP